jgi:hypothetical protein
MTGLLLGSAYAVSAGIIIYSIERDYIASEDAAKFLIAWAAAGLVLAVLAVVLRRRDRE